MEVEITIRVRAIIPDGLHLPRLGVDKNLDIPLHYLEGIPPVVHSVGITPKILTVQQAIRPTPKGGMSRPLDDALNTDPAAPTNSGDNKPATTS